jgi:hypothetical protein
MLGGHDVPLTKVRLRRWKLGRQKARYFRQHTKFAQMPAGGEESYNAVKKFEAAKGELQALEMGTVRYQLSQYGLPAPNAEDASMWEIRPDGLWVFSKKCLSEARTAIRNEPNERWKMWELRMKVPAAAVVLITSTVGLFALLRL